MSNGQRIPLPPGLPSSLISKEVEFSALWKLLEIDSRAQREQLVNQPSVRNFPKNRPAKSASKHKSSVNRRNQQDIADFYSSPSERRSVWCSYYEATSGLQKFPNQGHIPSLEYLALKNYRQDFADATIDDSELLNCGELVDLEQEHPDWRTPALALLPSIKSDLTNWQSLTPERKDATTLAAFSVATILDDARLIHWAADEITDLAYEFEFGLAIRKKPPPGVIGEQPGEYTKQDGDGSERQPNDTFRALKQACQELSQAALGLANEPLAETLFDRIAKGAEEIANLREPLLKAAAEKEIDAHIDQFTEFLRDQADLAPWFSGEADKIASRWKDAYKATNKSEISRLNADLDRAKRDTTSRLKEWVARSAQLADARDKLSACQGEISMAQNVKAHRKAREREDQLLQAIRHASDQEREALNQVLVAASPNSAPIDPLTGTTSQPDRETDSGGTFDTAGNDQGSSDGHGKGPDTENNQPESTASNGASETCQPTPIRSSDSDKGLETTNKEPISTPTSSGEKRPDTPEIPVEGEKDPIVTPEELAVWHAICDGRTSLGYQITLLQSQLKQAENVRPNPHLLAAVALGECLCSPEGDLAQEFAQHAKALLTLKHYDDDFAETDNDAKTDDNAETKNDEKTKKDREIKDAHYLLLLSASLRPALFAPQSGAILMLQKVALSRELSAAYHLAEKVAEGAQHLQGIHFDVTRLYAILGATAWESRLEEHIDSVRNWQISARVERFLFAPAGKVWTYWLNKGGVLFELAGLITDDNETSVSRVDEIIATFEDNKLFTQFVEYTFQNKLGHKTESRISGRALTQLTGHVKKVVKLARNWIKIIESKPRNDGYVENKVADLRGDIEKFAPKALAAIEQVQQRTPGVELTAALKSAEISIESLLHLFTQNMDTVDSETSPDPHRLLNRELLFVAELKLGADGGIDEKCPTTDALALLTNTEAHQKSLLEAFEVRMSRGDIAGAEAVCEQMAFEDDSQEDSCRNQLNRVFAEIRLEFENQIDVLSEKLELTFNMGEVDETELNELNAIIASARALLSRGDSVVEADRIVAEISAGIGESFNRAIERMRIQFAEYLPIESEREQALVDHTFETEDLLSLHELLDRLKSGDTLLPRETRELTPLKKFLSTVNLIEDYLSENGPPPPNTVVRYVSKGHDIFGLSFSSLAGSQIKLADKLLNCWYELARVRTADESKIRELLQCMGFSVRHCRLNGENRVAASVEPLRRRELCPIHPYGSTANGQYEIVLNWRSPPQEAIVQLVGEIRNRSVIVFHFGRLSLDEREWLRAWCVNNRSPLLVADECVMLHVASFNAGALRAFFDCTLPYAAAQPFFTAAGLVPPESFYGREKERQQVMDLWGSCFVYGGRQLGKTALLRSVEADFHEPDTGRIAKWVDLKVHDIGIAHGAEHIWRLLWEILQELVVINPDERLPQGRNSQIDAVEKAVLKWLSAGQDSRILLLLDEADAFLADDLKHDFRESTRLKGLMDRSERKFKAVFSGLHNVLRTTEQANHPLAHLGEPICVGPLLSNGELEQARALLQEPLAAAGCEFETDNLPTHVLVWTNYYPSLIQLYGAELVRYLHDRAVRPFPYTVTKKDIKAVFAKDGLRDYIRQRFSLTLQLDPRYEVIAYALALRMQADANKLSQGLRAHEIRTLAKDWWAPGFEVSEKEFDTLLQELSGLGVLKRYRSEGERPRYTFRNPNVLFLLGDSKEIEEVLCKERDVPQSFEASAFHAQYPVNNRRQSPRRGPPTYEQENLLARSGGVAIVSGTQASNLQCLGEFLHQRLDEGTCRDLKLCTDESALASQLTGLRPSARGVHVYLVPSESAWTLRWIERAASVLKRVKRGNRMRVVFSASPKQLWRFVVDLPERYLEESNGLFEWFGIQPWNHAFLHRWCSDQNLQVAKPEVDDLLNLSGGWPSILERYTNSLEHNLQARMQELHDYIDEHRQDLLDMLGLGTPEAQKDLFALKDWEAFTPEQARDAGSMIAEVDESATVGDTLVRRLWWAKQLGLVQDIQGTWGLNSLVNELLPTGNP